MATYTPPEPKRAMRQNLIFLREYAKRVIVEGDESVTALEDVKEALIEEIWKVGKSYQLTGEIWQCSFTKGYCPHAVDSDG